MNASRRLIALTLGTLSTGLLALGAPSGLAASSTGTLSVTALVANSCTIGNATLDFGTYSSVTGASGTANANVNCTLLTPYTLTMNQGQNASGGSNRMKAVVSGTTYYIPYSASFDGAAVVGAVNGVGGTLSLSGVGTGVAVPTGLMGTATAGANVPAATYTDSVLMTVTY